MKEGKMYTSILMVALSGFAPSATAADAPIWLTDYRTALKQGASKNKPVAVVLAPGANGWRKLANEGDLSNTAREILESQYVCVHINTATTEGMRLAKGFDLPSGLGIVISDRTASLQAFYHEGDLTDEKMVRYLQRYGDPQYTVTTTETNPSERRRGGSGSGGTVGYCPTCTVYPSCSSCGGCGGGRGRRR
jgi:hypothetical protein